MSEQLENVFRGYFGDETIINIFLSCLPVITNKVITIADFGGGNGILSKRIKKYYELHGCTVNIYIVDIGEAEIKNMDGIHTIKSDLCDFSKTSFFDLIIMRSVLQFFNQNQKNKVLDNIYNSLKFGGYFINQAIFFESPDNRIVEKIYLKFKRFVKLTSLNTLINLYKKSTFRSCKILKFCPPLVVDNDGLKKRFNLKASMLKEIYDYLQSNTNSTHHVHTLAKGNKNRFEIYGNFVILKAEKK